MTFVDVKKVLLECLPKNFLYGQNLLADKNNNNKKFPFVYE